MAQTRAQDQASDHPLLGTEKQRAARLRAALEGLDYVPGEVLVKFKDGVGSAAASGVLRLARHGGEPIQEHWIHDILHARAEGEQDVRDLVDQLVRQPEVEWAHPNYIYRLESVPNDPSFTRQWNLSLLEMPRAWDLTSGGSSSVTVAVIDSGLTPSAFTSSFRLWQGGSSFGTFAIPFAANPEIARSRIVEARDFVYWNGPVFDASGHGSHVAGTVLQETNNNLGLAGMAYGARLMALKACYASWELNFELGREGIRQRVYDGGCDLNAILSAIYYAADRGVQVINLSLGGTQPTPAYQTALRYARDRGVFVAIAAGNAFTDGNPTSYPAFYARDLDGVMTVGATNRNGARAYYSNTGTYVEIAAPGGDIRQGSANGIYQASMFEPDLDPTGVLIPRFDRYTEVSFQGTSMASPHVAGLAALLYAQGLTNPAAVEAAIKRFARDIGSTGRDNEFGYGLIDPPATLRGLGYVR